LSLRALHLGFRLSGLLRFITDLVILSSCNPSPVLFSASCALGSHRPTPQKKPRQFATELSRQKGTCLPGEAQHQRNRQRWGSSIGGKPLTQHRAEPLVAMSGDRPSRTKKPRSAEASGAKWHLQRGVRRNASNGETRRCNNGFGAQGTRNFFNASAFLRSR
jgi:hypothetical protein